jgi:Kef-type K+ transport system membrane component KefB
MIPSVYERLHITPGVSAVIVSLALMLIAGFAMTRLTSKLRLPNVTAYIVSGILLGPFCLDLVPRGVIDGMSFLADIALAFIAFSTGEFFRISTLKKSGAKVLVITVLEACLASALVFLVCYFPLGLDLNFSLVLGALAAATAPASTVMTIRQTGAKGDFVDTLLQVVALDDAVGLVAYRRCGGGYGELRSSLRSPAARRQSAGVLSRRCVRAAAEALSGRALGG